VDLTALIARESGFSIDQPGFEVEMQAQKDRSRKASESETGDWMQVNEGESEFVGYDFEETITQILKFRTQTQGKEKALQVVLEKNPFYGESGGQVGDKGEIILEGKEGKFKLEVRDTKKENELSILYCVYHPEAEKWLRSAEKVEARINPDLRKKTAGHHSATHLLHSALKETLGNHVAQKGSLVSPDTLRFDFSHFAKINPDELQQIENRVNEKIRANISLQEYRNMPIKEAMDLGATALFGDKYGDFVRVIVFDPSYSMELCGGTHVKSTGEIGWFKLVSESSVAAGVRRIEALAGSEAQQFLTRKIQVLDEVGEVLNQPKDLVKAVQQLLQEKNALQKKMEEAELERKQQIKLDLIEKAEIKNDTTKIIAEVKVGNSDTLKQLAFELKEQFPHLFLVLVSAVEGKPQLAVMIGESLIQRKGLNASQIARELAKEIKGGGGGQPFFATAGGSDVSGIPLLLDKARGFSL
jgi:alanyl-tRNA synthetase